MKQIIIITAPSGAGKTTLIKQLLKNHPKLTFSLSTTTRPKRKKEKDGVDYNFVDEQTFKQMIDANEFAEWAIVHSSYYGTRKKDVENILEKGYTCIFDVDVQGANSLRKAYKDKCKSIFIIPPSLEVLEERLRARSSETEETLKTRLSNAKKEIEEKDKFDVVIVNDDIQVAYHELENAVFE